MKTAHFSDGIAKHNYDYGRQLVRQGYLVVAPCFTPFGRRVDAPLRAAQKDPCAMVFIRLAVLGRTTIGENLRDARWALDYAASRPEAIADRMGCVGLSYGGRMTMLTAALDPRIDVAVISGAQNIYEERLTQDGFCGSQVIPGLAQFGDIPEIGSLTAPGFDQPGEAKWEGDPAWSSRGRTGRQLDQRLKSSAPSPWSASLRSMGTNCSLR